MSAPAVEASVVTGPGVYDLSEDVYHGDPIPGGSLSASGAKRLLPPSCPALFRYEADHGRPNRRAFDVGHAAHKMVLGVGAELVVIEADNYQTKAAKATRDETYAADKVPVLVDEYRQVQEMAGALRAHPWASVLFDPANGQPEQSMFWVDDEFGVWCRARVDWLPNLNSQGRLIVPDYKTAASADSGSISRAVANYGYHQQSAFYLAAVRALGLGKDDAAFLFVVQEKTPPYLVNVVELDGRALEIGRERNRRALEVFRDCQESGFWPGYSTDIELISLPAWAERQHEREVW